MKSSKQDTNIIKYRKKRPINIGFVAFALIFIYLIATMVTTITTPHVSVYEVHQGSILKDSSYTALALREEVVVYAESTGYINYYTEEQSKVRVGTKVYTVSDEKIDFDNSSNNEEITLTSEESLAMILKIQSYNNQFDPFNFSATYNLKNEMQNDLNKHAEHNKVVQLDEMISKNQYPGLKVKTAAKDGIIVYAIDGMEDLTLDTITADQLKKTDYSKTTFNHNMKITSGKPIYKLVTSNAWTLVTEVTDDTKIALTDKTKVTVKFRKDDQKLNANISFLENSDKNLLCLSFNDSMIRYVGERYLDIELILEDKSGLKIPKTAKTKKDFYVVPKSYITTGGNSNHNGVMRQQLNAKGESITEFKNVTIYYEKDDMVYLDPNDFNEHDILIKPESSETFALETTRSLKGVYCINKGYAVFKQIKILCESDDYYIIEEGNSFGLSNYDHIALDSKSINENQIIY